MTMKKQVAPLQGDEVLLYDELVLAYVDNPGDYTWLEALEIAKERDQAAADQLRLDALVGV